MYDWREGAKKQIAKKSQKIHKIQTTNFLPSLYKTTNFNKNQKTK